MKKASAIRRKLQHILQNKTFDSLDEYIEADAWEKMSDDDRELLGLLFIMRGEGLFKVGSPKGIECFNHAKAIAPKSSNVFYRLATVLSAQANNPGNLEAACKHYEIAFDLNRTSSNILYAWGNALVQKGLCLSDPQSFRDAEEKFALALSLQSTLSDATLGELYWQWGQSWYLQGKNSGEAIDFHYALDKYRHAMEMGVAAAEFWKDCGDVHFELAALMNRSELYDQSLAYFQKAVELSPDFFEGWLSLALASQQLYEWKRETSMFNLANAGFINASKLSEDSLILWYKWGLLLLLHGKETYDLELLQSSLTKFQKANTLEPDLAVVLASWAEAEIAYASLHEQIDLLKSAEDKIRTSLKLQPDSPEIWHLYGVCLNEFGRYFSDEQFYRRAIEKFQYGLSLKRDFGQLWHGMALSCFAIGELADDANMIEKSIRYCTMAYECKIPLSSTFWTDWGVALMKLAELKNNKSSVESAIEKFERAIIAARNSDDGHALDAELLYNYGCALDFLGDFYEDPSYYERAVQVLAKAYQLEPTHLHIRYNLAVALSHLGELAADVECFHKAIDHFHSLISLDSEEEMVWNEYGLTLLNLAELVYDPVLPQKSASYYSQAEQKLMQALSLGCVQACYNLACLYSLTENYSSAMYYLEKAEQQGAFPALEDVMQDEWLEGLRNTQVFKSFAAYLTGKAKKSES